MISKPHNTFYEYEDCLKQSTDTLARALEEAGIYLRRVAWLQKLRLFLSILWVGERGTAKWKYVTHNPIILRQAFKNWVRVLKLIFK